MSDLECIFCGDTFGFHEASRLDEEGKMDKHEVKPKENVNRRDCGCVDIKDEVLGWITKPCDEHRREHTYE